MRPVHNCERWPLRPPGDSRRTVYDNVDVFNGTHWRTIDHLVVARHLGGLAVDCVCNQIHMVTGSQVNFHGMPLKSMETYFPSGAVTPSLA
jgi:hypothetical protein